MMNKPYGVFGMPVQSSSLTAPQPPVAPPTAGPAMSGPEPGQVGLYHGFDDGGAVDDQDVNQPLDDQDTKNDYTVSLPYAVQQAQQALEYGRQQHGIPPEAFGGPSDSTSVIGTMSKLAPSTGAGAQDSQDQASAYDDGGEVEPDEPDQDSDDSQGQQQTQDQGVMPSAPPQAQPMQDPQQAVRGYVLGAGAMPPHEYTALEQQADPTGQMDPAERKLRMFGMSQDPNQQWALLQHNRQKFGAYGAFARAALMGSRAKPPNLMEATKYATAAFDNVPSGMKVTFMPAHNQGVAVHIKDLTGGMQDSASDQDQEGAQSFDDGGEVLDDPYQSTDQPANQGIDQEAVDRSTKDQVFYIPPKRMEELLGDFDQAMQPDRVLDYYNQNRGAIDQGFQSAAAQPQDTGDEVVDYYNQNKGAIDKGFQSAMGNEEPQPNQETEGSQRPPQETPEPTTEARGTTPVAAKPQGRRGMETNMHLLGGNYDFEGGPENFPKKDTTSAYGQIQQRAQNIFPMASQQKQRDAYISAMQMQALKNEGGEHVAKVRSEGQEAGEKEKTHRAEIGSQTKRDVVGAQQAGATERNVNTNEARRYGADVGAQTKRDISEAEIAGRNLNNIRTNQPGMRGDKLIQEGQRTAPSIPGGGQPAGRQAPTQRSQLPPAATSKLLEMLKQNPTQALAIVDAFNRKAQQSGFGPNAALAVPGIQQYLGQ